MKNKLFNYLVVGMVTVSALANPFGIFAESSQEAVQNIDLEDVLDATHQDVTVEQAQKDFESVVSDDVEIAENEIAAYSLDQKQTSQYIYLSDLNYLSQSAAGWGNIQKDKNVDGGTITLLIDGEKTFFYKGLGAHATSHLIYDLSQVDKEYSRFSSYVGVDHSKVGKSDGVRFAVYVSNYENKEWQLVGSTEVLRPQDNAYKFEIGDTECVFENGSLTCKIREDK